MNRKCKNVFFDLRYEFLKRTLKIIENREHEEIIISRLNKTLNTNSLFIVMKVIFLMKNHKLKRCHSLNKHFSYFRKISEKDNQYVRGRKILESRLSSIGCELKATVEDGNCLFRSISSNLFEKQKYHMYVRRRCVEHMLKYKEEYSVYFEQSKEFDAYLRKMSKNGYWGDELCIKATADVFHCNVHIVTSTDQNWYLIYESNNKETEVRKKIFLAYLSPVHYDYFKLADTPR